MCFMFGCCGPPPHATIKAYNNTTPFALDWYDDRDGGAGGIRETAIIDWNDETGYSIGVLSVGDGAEVTGSTNETALVERDADDGDRQTESTSSPLVASGQATPATMMKSTPVSGPSGGAWLWAGTSGSSVQFFDLDVVQQCTASAGITAVSVGLADQLNVVVGRSAGLFLGSTLATRLNSAGVVQDTLVTADVPGAASAFVPRSDAVSSFLLIGGTVASTRSLWVCDKTTLAVTATGTPVTISDITENYTFYCGTLTSSNRMRDCGRDSRINGTHAILHLRDGSGGWQEDGATLVCVELDNGLGDPEEAWTLADKTRRFVALDSTQVYTLNPTAGELSAVTLTTGAEAWTLDLSDETKLGTSSGQVFGAVLSSGNIAVWRNAGVTIVNTSGTEIATVDVGPCYGIVEKSNRWIIVGGKRTTES